MATTDKYDRQLRLWGASGQRALGSTLVVLVGSSACGTETLKNLVLPGVGSFLVLDDDDDDDGAASTSNGDGVVTVQLAEQEAAMACTLLSELNPDAIGFHSTVPSLSAVNFAALLQSLTTNPPITTSTSHKLLVISADQPPHITLPLSHACHSLSIPMVHVRSYGLLGYVRIQTALPYHCIVESKPSHRIPDLRLSAWPLFDGLRHVHDGISNLDGMEDSKEHSHVPYVVILLQALEKWRGTVSAPFHPDPKLRPRYPETFAEKEEYRKVVRSMAINLNNEVNFEEALQNAHLVWADGRLGEETNNSSSNNSSGVVPVHVLQFQLMVLALKRFLKENDEYPPLEGTIPDMTADTKTFVALQEAYQQQAEMDRAKFDALVSTLLEECHQKANGCDVRVTKPTDDEIVTFCKNTRYIRILETRPLYAEYKEQDPSSPIISTLAKSNIFTSPSNPNFDEIQSYGRDDLNASTMDPYVDDPIQTPMLWWIALRACDAFYDRHEHYPGKHDQALALEADATEVYKLMVEVVGNLGLKECDFIKVYLLDEAKGKNLAREVVRYDEAEIHSIAAVLGGVASQEAVKLITGQYVPFDDTYVYNGIASTAGVYRF
ncbi:predicted protein [Thalassiosira pseudonana CCMP1335]|uniref:NEDD8-activating enzyme E1 regulatory subunit n=1 Tax=Thalassiosira pseudonana TaxID=35128 RepID=B8C5J4_THAPS|nr:predicted protein [Thalassiosira pseudonana CCMP1335]EED91129.1 predicted protein [Thalassiosira pseudonana CCMP1335]